LVIEDPSPNQSEGWFQDVSAFKKSKQDGVAFDFSVRKRKVEKVSESTSLCKKPKGSFYPMKAYKEFMKGKKADRRHKATCQHGVRGMYVPHEDVESVPWEMEDIDAKTVRTVEAFDPDDEFGDEAVDDIHRDLVDDQRRTVSGEPRRKLKREGSAVSEEPPAAGLVEGGKKKSKNPVAAKATAKAKPVAKAGCRGRPPKDIPKYTNDMASMFEKADAESTFFSGECIGVTREALKRAINKVNEQLIAPKDDDQMRELVQVKKQLQIMESSIAVVMMKGSTVQWRRQAIEMMETMLIFIQSQPIVNVTLPTYLFDFYMTQLVAVSSPKLVQLVRSQSLQGMGFSDWEAGQRRYIKDP
jgi:hypothetical protein